MLLLLTGKRKLSQVKEWQHSYPKISQIHVERPHLRQSTTPLQSAVVSLLAVEATMQPSQRTENHSKLQRFAEDPRPSQETATARCFQGRALHSEQNLLQGLEDHGTTREPLSSRQLGQLPCWADTSPTNFSNASGLKNIADNESCAP